MRRAMVLLVGLALVAMPAWGASEGTVSVEIGGWDADRTVTIPIKGYDALTPTQAEAVEVGINAFFAACPFVAQYWEDVGEAHAQVADVPSITARGKTLGWRREIRITVRIVEQPKDIPSDLAAGDRLMVYFLGGGRSPGVVAQKDVAKRLCPMAMTQGDSFLPEPVLSVLGNL